ncbi:zinc-dependent metalloprotease [Mucilaginibacter dorajii]|uniref:Zinc-dependent metalloprotease n=1 Tax=Mucilaginibacter dorajii TaxID=692994 RepID=A0ABP7QZ18_9SPHI|nr:zinc-dependent metalloprotease [Mucilaginibacter dorajii]MCS3732307.1 hypothetical protein [Mucilaginibacter dorajii]
MKRLMMAAALLLAMEGYAQKKTTKLDGPTAIVKADTAKSVPVKPYNQVITAKAVTMQGMITVHRLESKFYLEIPDSLLGRELLLVDRIAKSPVDGPINPDGYYAGDQIGERVIIFEKSAGDKIFVRGVSYMMHAADSTGNGMYRSVLNSNLQPILATFPVKAYHSPQGSSVIDVTDAVGEDNGIFSFPAGRKAAFLIGAQLRDRSYTKYIKAFSGNVEIRTVKTFSSSQPGGDPLTFELNNSLVLLPKIPMLARIADQRVGYFSTGYVDFDADPQGVTRTEMITRWRLEPKDQDREKYFRGEQVEPKKPIIFYIDPATPKKWVPYLIQGVNDWQVAFEQAGFKNAIYAREAPVNDSTWSIEDASHSAIVYKPSTIANAMGPHIHDPRSGEILEAHVSWYHNVMSLLHDWYMIQAGAIDKRARKMEFDEELMGQLIRFVSSHEIGHTLGLMHNMGASSTVPVDSLRNKTWVEKHGHTPSIMDYARFNYVAQPEDSIGVKGIYPRINDYDKWAVEWGYKRFPGIQLPKDEKTLLNKWIIDSLSGNHRLWYGPQQLFLSTDPRSTNEDLGDDAMKAGSYGIKNLKRILPKLPEWTHRPDEGYDDLTKMYQELLSQYTRYAGHVINNVGGIYLEYKSVEEKGDLYTPVPPEKQKRAVAWLNQEVFKTPEWLLYTPVTEKTESYYGASYVTKAGTKLLGELLNGSRLASLINVAERYRCKNTYSCNAFLNDLDNGLWSELHTHARIRPYRRALQNNYIELLGRIILPPVQVGTSVAAGPPQSTELLIVLKPHLRLLQKAILAAIPASTDAASKAHLQLCSEKIENVLHPKK